MDLPSRRLYSHNNRNFKMFHQQINNFIPSICKNRSCMLEGHNHFSYSPCIFRFKID